MAETSELQPMREERFFASWDGFVDPAAITASEENLRRLIDDLIALGPQMSEASARQAVEACVSRFNDLDDGWINTMERETIDEQIGRVIDTVGFDYDDDWVDAREW